MGKRLKITPFKSVHTDENYRLKTITRFNPDLVLELITNKIITDLLETLFVACHYGHYDLAIYLTKYIEYEQAMFDVAARYGHLNIVKHISSQEYGNDFVITQVLRGAIENLQNDVIKYLIERYSRRYIVPLDTFIKTKDTEMIKYLVEKNRVDLDEACIYFSSIGDIEMVKELYQDDVPKALKLACRNGHFEVVKYLITRGTTISGDCFILACSHGHLEIVKYLYDLDDNLLQSKNFLALKMSASNRHYEVFKFLFEQPNYSYNLKTMLTCLDYAGFNNQIRIIKLIVEKYHIRSWIQIEPVLINICKRGYLNILEYLYKKVDCVKLTPARLLLTNASENGHLNIIKFIIRRKFKISDFDIVHSFTAACYNNDVEIVKYLYGYKNKDGIEVIKNNINNNMFNISSIDILKFYIEKNISINYNTIINTSITLREDNIDMFKYMITHYPEKIQNDHFTLAINNNKITIIDLMLNKGFDINYCNGKCLTYAIFYNNYQTVRYLLNHGAVILNTHMDECIRNGTVKILELLLSYGGVINPDFLLSISNNYKIGVIEHIFKNYKSRINISKLKNKRFATLIQNVVTYHLNIHKKWVKIRKAFFKPDLPKTIWQDNKIDHNELQKIVKSVGLFIHKEDGTEYSSYLLKVQLAIQMTTFQSVPTIIYEHLDCNNLDSPICHELITVPEHELIKDINQNWYHVTDLIDASGNWQMSKNPYTKDEWYFTDDQITLIKNERKKYENDIINKIHDAHKLIKEEEITFNIVRSILIELDNSIYSNNIEKILKINVDELLQFFMDKVVSTRFFRKYSDEEIKLITQHRGIDALYKFLIITRTIMSDINLATYLNQYLNFVNIINTVIERLEDNIIDTNSTIIERLGGLINRIDRTLSSI